LSPDVTLVTPSTLANIALSVWPIFPAPIIPIFIESTSLAGCTR
jgi:hypothetical protein